MQKDFSWQQVHDVSTLSRGLLLSATDNSFILKNIENNTILQTLPCYDYISENYKYTCEMLDAIQRDLSCSFDDETVFYDDLSSQKISDLCECNCLLF